jgi:hypothetical protein
MGEETTGATTLGGTCQSPATPPIHPVNPVHPVPSPLRRRVDRCGSCFSQAGRRPPQSSSQTQPWGDFGQDKQDGQDGRGDYWAGDAWRRVPIPSQPPIHPVNPVHPVPSPLRRVVDRCGSCFSQAGRRPLQRSSQTQPWGDFGQDKQDEQDGRGDYWGDDAWRNVPKPSHPPLSIL